MLTYEALIEQAKLKNMPATKIRGILREYLQILILKELSRCKNGKKLCFTGGTYLRLALNLKRFSEDMDFNASRLSRDEFENTLGKIKTELKRSGFNTYFEFHHWRNIYAAKLIFPEIEKEYNVVSPHSKKEGITIKIEANNPEWEVPGKTEIISGFGEMYPCLCANVDILFADKIDAFIKKKRGRHLYDLIFLLTNKHHISRKNLAFFGITQDPLEAILNRANQLSHNELAQQAEGLRPFLFEEKEADLIIHAKEILPSLLQKYRQEVGE